MGERSPGRPRISGIPEGYRATVDQEGIPTIEKISDGDGVKVRGAELFRRENPTNTAKMGGRRRLSSIRLEDSLARLREQKETAPSDARDGLD